MKPPDFKPRLLPLEERAAPLRAHLASSRADLLASSAALREAAARRTPPWRLRGHELVNTAPNMTLLAAVLVCALVAGPRKTALVVVRNGLAGWLGGQERKASLPRIA
jgi:hypothetical protein